MDSIFISYSHQDEKWKDRIQSHLTVLEKNDKLTIWDDRQIALGGDWLNNIEQSLEKATIALLLVSRHFLNSDFIRNKEIPELLQRSEQDGLKVIPVMLTPCSWQQVTWLSKIQGYPKDNKPLSGLTEHQIDEALAALGNRLVETQPSTPSSTAAAVYTPITPSHNVSSTSNINANDNAQPIVANDSANITVNNNQGISLEEYEAGLLRQEKRLREEFRNNTGSPTELKRLKAQLDAVSDNLLNLQSSYEESQKLLQEADQALEILKNELPVAQVKKAQALLAKNDTGAAKEAFNDIVEKGSPSMALAAYESGRLEENDINYDNAMKQYSIAVTLEDSNPDYLSAAGTMARTLGDYSTSRKWLEILLKLREQAGGKTIDIAYAQHDLAWVYEDMGEYKKAETLYKRSIFIKESSMGKNHPEVATTLNNLAGLYQTQGEYLKAEPTFQRALDITEKSIGKENTDFARTLNNLALLHKDQGYYEKAQPLFQHSLKVFEKSFGKEHPDIAVALSNLAQLYCEQDKYEKAESLFKRSLKISEKYFNKDHLEITKTLNGLAGLYHNQGKYIKAESLFQRSLKIYESSLGKEHHYVTVTLNNLAWLYQNQGKYEKSEQLFQRCLQTKEKSLGKEHPSLAVTLNNLALLYDKQGKLELSLVYIKRAITILGKKLPVTHPHLMHSNQTLKFLQAKLAIK
ncbi:toll/interleukin-1 receptor domain-containing protein [Leucothrix arctica]|uniref:TIR domain-containing protein n=1 Tax=Leucothrix arctica TaxID=1481894 RepID=A0A317CFR6_9GAMM|nr:toll/interleukin-1 receptor domain-containing protein [Leucothrix arctica]PWQ96243.1 hypothetical protein DKT75_09630 [Leucothrix arctica]